MDDGNKKQLSSSFLAHMGHWLVGFLGSLHACALSGMARPLNWIARMVYLEVRLCHASTRLH